MEILESQDPEKKKLIETSERHRRELEKNMSELSEKTEKILTNALIIGGALALSYFVVSRLTSGGKKKKKKKKKKEIIRGNSPVTSSLDEEEDIDAGQEQGLLAQIGTKVANQATLILIDIAREKLMDYLESRKKEE